MSRSRFCLTPLRPRTTTVTKTFHRHRAGGEPGNEGNDTCDNSYLLLWFLALVSSVVYYITQTRGMSLLVVHLNIFSPLVVPCIGYHWAVLIVSQWFSWSSQWLWCVASSCEGLLWFPEVPIASEPDPLRERKGLGTLLPSSCPQDEILTWPIRIVDCKWHHGNGFSPGFQCCQWRKRLGTCPHSSCPYRMQLCMGN